MVRILSFLAFLAFLAFLSLYHCITDFLYFYISIFIFIYIASYSGTDAGVKIKSERGRGGIVQNVLYSNIQLSHVPTAIIIQQHYHGGDDHTGEAPTYRNITLRNITADSSVGR